LGFLFPVTSRITIAAKSSGHVAFHSLAVFWTDNFSIAARAPHVFAQCNRLEDLTTIKVVNGKLMGQKFNIKGEVQNPLWFTIDK